MTRPIDRLLEIMARLRDPQGGCPWDLAQSYATIVPHTIEEAYEVADAIGRGDRAALRDELGDLLFQVVFYAELAREEGAFDFDGVAQAIADKMVHRHPHVFPPPVSLPNGDSAAIGDGSYARWEEGKAAERAREAEAQGRRPGALDGVALALPALTRALKLQKRAARVGFDWSEADQVLDKITEEIGELRAEIATGADPARTGDELGDLLFALVNLARHLGVDPEAALRGTNAKFERRFRHIETALAEDGRSPEAANLEEMEALWQAAKQVEKA